MKRLFLFGLILSSSASAQFDLNLGRLIQGTWVFHSGQQLVNSAYKIVFRGDASCELLMSAGSGECRWSVRDREIAIEMEQAVRLSGFTNAVNPTTGELVEAEYEGRIEAFTLSLEKFDFIQPSWKITYDEIRDYPQNPELPSEVIESFDPPVLVAQRYKSLKPFKKTGLLALNLAVGDGNFGGVIRINDDQSASMEAGFMGLEQKSLFWSQTEDGLMLSYSPGESSVFRVLNHRRLGTYVLVEINQFGKKSVQASFVGQVDEALWKKQQLSEDEFRGTWVFDSTEPYQYTFGENGFYSMGDPTEEPPYIAEGTWRIEKDKLAAYRYWDSETGQRFSADTAKLCLNEEIDCDLFQSRTYKILNRRDDQILVLRELSVPWFDLSSNFVHTFVRL